MGCNSSKPRAALVNRAKFTRIYHPARRLRLMHAMGGLIPLRKDRLRELERLVRSSNDLGETVVDLMNRASRSHDQAYSLSASFWRLFESDDLVDIHRRDQAEADRKGIAWVALVKDALELVKQIDRDVGARLEQGLREAADNMGGAAQITMMQGRLIAAARALGLDL